MYYCEKPLRDSEVKFNIMQSLIFRRINMEDHETIKMMLSTPPSIYFIFIYWKDGFKNSLDS